MDVGLTKCAREGCEKTFKPHHWGTKQASREGWFHQRDGDSWCPDHIPEWVEGWRKRKAEKEKKKAEEKAAVGPSLAEQIYATIPVFVDEKKVGFAHIRKDGYIMIEPFYNEALLYRGMEMFGIGLSEGFTVGVTMTPAVPAKVQPESDDHIFKGVN